MAQVVIIGAGISGLATAYYLQRLAPDATVRVVDAANRPGGTVWTEHTDGFVIEHGPNGFLDNVPATIELARALGLGERLVAASEAARKHRYLYLNEQLQELPGGPGSFLKSPLLNWRGKLRLIGERLIKRGPGTAESVAMFARGRFGRQAADVFIDALVTGIHGGDPELLDIRSAFPRLSRYEAEAGSIIRGVLHASRLKKRAAKARGKKYSAPRMWSFPGGLREFIDALTSQLRTPPMYNWPARRLEKRTNGWVVHGHSKEELRADAVVLACPANIQANIVSDLDEPLANYLGSIPYNRIAVVALGYRANDVLCPYDGFGFIAPQNTRQDLLGVQWCSAIYPSRAPDGMVLWRALCGGWHRGEVADWPQERLIAAVADVLRKVHGITVPPTFVRIVRWPRAIPQYTLGHPERVALIEERAAQHPGLFLTGNSLRGVALNDCVADGQRTALRCAERLTANAPAP